MGARHDVPVKRDRERETDIETDRWERAMMHDVPVKQRQRERQTDRQTDRREIIGSGLKRTDRVRQIDSYSEETYR